jgi:flavin reductase (DIM6/NTAB) family NADH-FMN oxidoreductase RutF
MEKDSVLQLRWKSYGYSKRRKDRGNLLDTNIKKQVLRTFTYGLYAVSCANEGEVNIFTANWLTQVSFEPPLVAVSIENVSKSLPMILRSRIFTVNVLRSGGRELAGKLGKSALQNPDKLYGIAFDIGANGCPILHEALAWVACEVRRTVETGDSTLVAAEVVDVGIVGEGPPLTMVEAGFRHAG